MVTNFDGGVSTAAQGATLGYFTMPDPSAAHVYFNDFDSYVAANWTVTVTQAGTGSATEALTNADGGILLITNDDADNDAVFFNKVGESFSMTAGKAAWFKCRFKTSDATQSDIVFGLQVTDTTPLDVTDGIYFLKADGVATVDVFCRKNATTGSTTAAAIATMADDTYITLGWYYDGAGSVSYFVNDVKIGTLDGSATYLPDTTLTVSFGIQNGEAVAKTLSVDYIFAAKQR